MTNKFHFWALMAFDWIDFMVKFTDNLKTSTMKISVFGPSPVVEGLEMHSLGP
jgi:hypothetical protein